MGKGMRAGKRKTKMGGGDMQKQLKQMQAMQREMEQSQAELAEREFTSTAGGGAVEVVINGNKEITKLNIDKDVVDPDDVEMLQDMVMAAGPADCRSERRHETGGCRCGAGNEQDYRRTGNPGTLGGAA